MNKILNHLATFSLATALSACGGSSGGANFIIGGGANVSDETGTVSIGLSDAPVDELKEVVIEIDKITLRKTGEDDVEIDRFTSTDLSIVDVDTFQIDLLQYRGNKQAIVIDNLVVTAGKYSDLILSILDEDSNKSYVVELDDTQVEIKVPSDTLQLGGFTVDADGVQTFTIEFDLRQALAYRTGPEVYNLKPRGIRIEDNATAATLLGTVESSLFDTGSPCDSKTDPNVGNVVYLYAGHDLDVTKLIDVYDPEVAIPPDESIEPFASTSVVAGATEGTYDFGFVLAGDYTLVLSCDAEGDDSETYDAITLPLPTDQVKEVSLGSTTETRFNFTD
ncbi:MAG: DUF4382 domain-containing protein [Pseudomonadales bacterium]